MKKISKKRTKKILRRKTRRNPPSHPGSGLPPGSHIKRLLGAPAAPVVPRELSTSIYVIRGMAQNIIRLAAEINRLLSKYPGHSVIPKQEDIAEKLFYTNGQFVYIRNTLAGGLG